MLRYVCITLSSGTTSLYVHIALIGMGLTLSTPIHPYLHFSLDRMVDSNDLEQAFEGRHVFLTGATGMLGTALLVKMIKDTRVASFHILVRGGESMFTLLGYRSHTDRVF